MAVMWLPNCLVRFYTLGSPGKARAIPGCLTDQGGASP